MRIHRHRQQKPKTAIPQFRINEKILSPEVRVVAPEGDLGVMETAKAIALAHEKELDLVEVSPKAEPPVCKILDFGHFKYQKEKEVRKQKAQSKEVEVKGIRLTFRIGEHDLDVRYQQAKKFLERGDKIKLELVLRGREKAHKDVAREIIDRFVARLQGDFNLRVEQAVSFQAGRLTTILARA